MAVNYTYAKRSDGSVELVPEGNIPYGSSQATQQEYQTYINSSPGPAGMSWNDYYARNDTPGLKEAHQTAMAGGTPVFGGVDAEGDIVRTDQIATRQANEQAVLSGQNREISPGLSVPVGSAADLSLQGQTQEQQLATPSVQTQVLQQGLDPQSPSTVTQNDIRNGPTQTYTVQQGDTLSQIAARMGVPVSSITGYRSGNPNLIYPGEVLTIQGTGTSAIGSGPQPVNTIVPQSSLGVTGTGMVPGTAPAVGTETSKSIDEYIKQLTPPKSETDKKADALTDRLSQLIGDTAGQAQMLAEEEKARGVEELNRQLTAKNNEIKMLIAEREALNVDNMGKPMTMNSIIGANAQVNAVIDSKIFYRTAEAQALMGNIELARESAQRAVDAKYGPILEELRIKQAQLELLQPQLDKEEKIRAAALERQYEDQKQAIAERAAKEKEITGTLLNQMQNYPDAGILLTDTLEQANRKITSKSKIYQDQIASLTPDPGMGDLTKDQRAYYNTVQDNARQDGNIKDFPAIRASFETARSAAQKKDGAGDIVLMRMIAKITDPTTGVREEEFRTFAGAQSTLAKFGITLTKQMWEGDRLTESGRTALLGQAQDIYGQREAAYKNSLNFYNGQLKDAGIDKPAVAEYYAPEMGNSSSLKVGIEEAEKNGYAPEEIIDYLKGQGYESQIDDAVKEGYSPQEIIDYLKGSSITSAPSNAQSIAGAIKQVESGGNYEAKGQSGEYGAYQFIPSTWKALAGKHLGNPNAPMTQQNQDKVALAEIQSLIDQGYSPREIALIWNGGEAKVKKGVNSYGIAYDSGAYANKVLKNLYA